MKSTNNKKTCKSRRLAQKAKARLYSTVIGIPNIGDLVLAYSSPQDTPDVVYALPNSQHLTTTLDWIRSRRVYTFDAVTQQHKMTVDGIPHSPTDAHEDVAIVCSDGLRIWAKWGQTHRGHGLPAWISPNLQLAQHYENGIDCATILSFAAYFAENRWSYWGKCKELCNSLATPIPWNPLHPHVPFV